jgi:hypothetical protein
MSNNTQMFEKLSDTGTAYTSGEPGKNNFNDKNKLELFRNNI